MTPRNADPTPTPRRRIRAIPQGPTCLFVHWESDPAPIAAIGDQHGIAPDHLRRVLRVVDSGAGPDGPFVDVEVEPEQQSHYVWLDAAGRTLRAEWGVRLPDGSLHRLLEAEPVVMPRDSVAPVGEATWMTLVDESDGMPGTPVVDDDWLEVDNVVDLPQPPPPEWISPGTEERMTQRVLERWSQLAWEPVVEDGERVWRATAADASADAVRRGDVQPPAVDADAVREIDVKRIGRRRLFRAEGGRARVVVGPWTITVCTRRGATRTADSTWSLVLSWYSDTTASVDSTRAIWRIIFGADAVPNGVEALMPVSTQDTAGGAAAHAAGTAPGLAPACAGSVHFALQPLGASNLLAGGSEQLLRFGASEAWTGSMASGRLHRRDWTTAGMPEEWQQWQWSGSLRSFAFAGAHAPASVPAAAARHGHPVATDDAQIGRQLTRPLEPATPPFRGKGPAEWLDEAGVQRSHRDGAPVHGVTPGTQYVELPGIDHRRHTLPRDTRSDSASALIPLASDERPAARAKTAVIRARHAAPTVPMPKQPTVGPSPPPSARSSAAGTPLSSLPDADRRMIQGLAGGALGGSVLSAIALIAGGNALAVLLMVAATVTAVVMGQRCANRGVRPLVDTLTMLATIGTGVSAAVVIAVGIFGLTGLPGLILIAVLLAAGWAVVHPLL